MKKTFLITIIFSIFYIAAAEAADFSGIWINKNDRYQITVTGSGDKYSFKKSSFYRGKPAEFSGTFTVKSNRLSLVYSSGQKAFATVKSPTHIVESSTVNWEKVSDSTRPPVFNITGTWKHFNSVIVLKQNGSSVSGSRFMDSSEYSKFEGEISGYLLRLTEKYTDPYSTRPLEHSLLILDNSRILVTAGRGSKDNLWQKSGSSTLVENNNQKSGSTAKVENNKKENRSEAKTRIDGTWVIDGIKSSVKISTRGDFVFFNTKFTLNSKEVAWTGNGKRKGDVIKINYRYIKNKPAGFEDGTMELRIVNDKRIEGKWISKSKRYTDRIVFIKK